MAAYIHVMNQRRPRTFRKRLNPLETYHNDEIKRKYRLTRPLIEQLCDTLDEQLAPNTNRNHAVPTVVQVCTALRFYATGSFQEVLGDGHGLSKATMSRIILRVSNAIVRTHRHVIRFPATQPEQQACKTGFH